MSVIIGYRLFKGATAGWAEVPLADFRQHIHPLLRAPAVAADNEYIQGLISRGGGPALLAVLGPKKITTAMLAAAPQLPPLTRDELASVVRTTLANCARRGWTAEQYRCLLASLDDPSLQQDDEMAFEMARPPRAATRQREAAETENDHKFEELYRLNPLVRACVQQLFQAAIEAAPAGDN